MGHVRHSGTAGAGRATCGTAHVRPAIHEANDQGATAAANSKHGAQKAALEAFDRATADSGLDPEYLKLLRRQAGQVSDEGYTSGATARGEATKGVGKDG
ncbi:hypothetical protein [Kitasatospora sp. NPDC059327]|uniref:hypothetical protein n=1 Tax=Kitasatospora sp. NPDC059327 TaxID=3346803 RepID=UPI00368FD80C